jgi:TolB-like protein/Tfp pilus assembly protein PilF
MPNKLSQFWQELKRRKVVRTITVYAAAAFVILELVSMSEEPFGLPEWTFVLAVILLSIGFLIAIILSWIYDIHPEEGVVKTEPADKVAKQDIPKSSNSWKIASYISFVVIVGLIVLNLIPRADEANISEVLDKSIAVLPFHNDSPNKENEYFINGTMESIRNKLSKIEDLKVISRSSVEQFRDTVLPIPEVAESLFVSYILEGSMQKYDNRIRMTLQLIDRNDKHIWSEQYDRDLKDIFDIQSEIAQLVAGEIKAIISNEEKNRIERIPTGNLEAYNEFLLGKYFYDYHHTIEGFREALRHLRMAIQIDSTFALAHFYVASSYQFMVRYNWIKADSVYHEVKNAILKSIELDETFGEAYAALGLFKIVFEWDLYGPDEEFRKAISLNPNSAEIYALYAQYLRWMRRFEEGKAMARRAIELDPVTPMTNLWLGAMYFYEGQYDESIAHLNRTRALDSTFIYANTHLAYAYTMKTDTAKALYYADKAMSGNIYETSAVGSMGWVYAKCGETEKAKEILNQLKLDRPDQPIYQAKIYCGLGEYNKALDLIYQAYENRSGTIIYLYAFAYSFLKELNQDPRFIELIHKIGFEVQ